MPTDLQVEKKNSVLMNRKYIFLRSWLIAVIILTLSSGCAGGGGGSSRAELRWRSFKITPPPEDFWQRTSDVADILALNNPSTSVLYFDNPYTGGIISLQVLPRHFPDNGKMIDELRYIYRRMLSSPHTNMRAVVNGIFLPFERAIQLETRGGVKRAEFFLRGSVGRRPSFEAREEARRALERTQPFGGPRKADEIKAERAFRSAQLTPAYTANYRGKVVVFLREEKLYEFYYFNHVAAFEGGLRVFDAFVKSIKFI